ncbi:hypothetical protein [Butyrivibrio proteoclasticus]|uniref:hypothetical protein n=1 Tax=Butyrivibrio proteoclasticus TaxID=43305 RepID=UPI00047B4CA4|nr:hypothetical protein [Butyrivibrio proteoclasticus]
MISLSYDEEEINIILDRYYESITQNRRFIINIEKLCQKYFACSFKKIVTLKPDEIGKFKTEFDNWDKRKIQAVRKRFKEISTISGKKSNYIVNTLFDKMPTDARNYIYELANTKTCPYCNRNYVDIVKDDEKNKYVSFFDLDHFYSKGNYPMLAVSAFNLIPTCPACNRIKGKKRLNYYPYDLSKKAGDSFNFTFNIVNAKLSSENDIDIDIVYNDSGIKKDKQGIYLKELYSNHKDVAIEVIQKARFQGMGYMNSLLTQLEDIFPDDKELYRMIYGNYLDEQDWNKRPLSKFTYDIAKETLAAYGIKI